MWTEGIVPPGVTQAAVHARSQLIGHAAGAHSQLLKPSLACRRRFPQLSSTCGDTPDSPQYD